jgi:mannose-1-phosphate guanylyltransferase
VGTWSIVLAGGAGRRLQGEAQRRYGYARPKQFCDFDGGGTLLARTLARSGRVVPHPRTVVLTTRGWRLEALESIGDRDVVHVEQPLRRDTGPGLLLPLLEVLWRDPQALVVVLPSDHHVEDDTAFAAVVKEAMAGARRAPERLWLLGATPDRPEEGYGWLVRAFREKPEPAELALLLAQGALASTFVMVARAQLLASLYARHLPRWWRALYQARGRPEDVEAAFHGLPSENFSERVLELAVSSLAVAPLGAVGWTDVGTPERLRRSLRAGADSHTGSCNLVRSRYPAA